MGSILEYLVRFTAHESAKQAANEAQKRGLCKYAFIAYRDYDQYDDRGW